MRGKEDDSHAGIGRKGEDIACKWLIDNGFTIIERNWRCGHLEIDIIGIRQSCEKKKEPCGFADESYALQFSGTAGNQRYIHFIEVKTRKEGSAVSPADAVDRRKQERLVMAAGGYIKSHHIKEEAVFDILAITYTISTVSVEFIERAFTPRW